MIFLKTIIIKFISLFSPLIKLWEHKCYKKYGSKPLLHQPIFIVASPRTGSTILTQVVTNQLDVLYFNNLSCRLSTNLFFAFWLSDKLYRNKPHNSHKSYYGSTINQGNNAPSECGKYWYRWLSKSKHHIRKNELSLKAKNQIKKEVTGVINYHNKPIIFTNNNMGVRIEMISEIFPEAKFIIGDRDPFFTAQSLLQARKIIQGSYEEWWSIMPPNFDDLIRLPFAKQVVLQHFYINKEIYDKVIIYYPENHLWINYTSFCEEQKAVMKIIKKFIGYYDERSDYKQVTISESKKIYLENSIISDLKKIIVTLDWDDYKSKA